MKPWDQWWTEDQVDQHSALWCQSALVWFSLMGEWLYLVQLVHCGADGAELVVGDATHCEHPVQDASVVDLEEKTDSQTDSTLRRRPRPQPPWRSSTRSQTLMQKSPRSSWLRISCTIFRHSASGIMASYCPAMSKSCLETTQWPQSPAETDLRLL